MSGSQDKGSAKKNDNQVWIALHPVCGAVPSKYGIVK